MSFSSSIPLVLIHAFPLHKGMWEPQRSAFGDQVELITLDLPGFGKAPGLDDEILTMDRAARYIQRELEAKGIDRCILGGLSMGGYITFECWKLFPEKIAGLILADTKATPDTEEGRKGRYAAADQIGQGKFDEFTEGLLKKLLCEKTHTERTGLLNAVREMIQESPEESAASALLGMAARADSTPLLPSITVPTVLIFGEHDAITTVDEGRSMLTAIPDARLHILQDAGHLSNLENPDGFNQGVLELVGRVRGL